MADPATEAVAPIKVDSQAKVANLNADTVDGQDAPLWAVINAAGLAENQHGMTGNRRVNKGRYQIFLNRDVSRCAHSATPWAQASDVYVQGSATSTVPITSNSAIVQVYTMDGSLQFNRGFSLVVHCRAMVPSNGFDRVGAHWEGEGAFLGLCLARAGRSRNTL